MNIEERKYSMTLVGNVQNKGFRAIIRHTAIEHHINGEVFNNSDGTVSVYYGGKNGDISDFLNDIKIKGKYVYIIFSITEKVELPLEVRLPQGFHIIDTDTPEDKERKFDEGIKLVRNINADISAIRREISSIDKNTSVLSEIVKDTSALPEIVKILQRIEEKL